jgi:hypothetical protein
MACVLVLAERALDPLPQIAAGLDVASTAPPNALPNALFKNGQLLLMARAFRIGLVNKHTHGSGLDRQPVRVFAASDCIPFSVTCERLAWLLPPRLILPSEKTF